jgi:hypothetical protein
MAKGKAKDFPPRTLTIGIHWTELDGKIHLDLQKMERELQENFLALEIRYEGKPNPK